MAKNKKENNAEERNLAMLSHLLGLFTGFIGPLIIFLVAKENQKFLKQIHYLIDNLFLLSNI